MADLVIYGTPVSPFVRKVEAVLRTQGVAYDFVEDVDAGHGRIETRRCWCSEDIAGVAPADDWADLRSVACIERIRDVGGKTSCQRHYYISSLPAKAKDLLTTSRGHWGVENQLHWPMDVVFGEDDSQ